MTASGVADSRIAMAGVTIPPWLWVWLAGYLVPATPGEIRDVRSIVTGFAWTWPPHSWTLSAAELFSSIFGVLVYVMVAAGVLGVMFPHLRGRWVERRFTLASRDDRPVVADMQQFVHEHDPSIRLMVCIRGDQMARIYPTGWRSARIAVFLPLTVLWRRDRTAAQAILLHEVAHRRQGDQLITGLGSPFVWLIRVCAPAYLLLILFPAAIYPAAGSGSLDTAETGLLIPSAILLPVIALWLAELGADQQAAQQTGSDALQQALREAVRPRVSLVARMMTLLSHPPRRLRRRCATVGPAGQAALIAAWPAALAAFFLISFLMHVPGPTPSDLSPHLRDLFLQLDVNSAVSDSKPLVIATALILLAWPALTAPWEWLWSSRKRSGRRGSWRPYLVTASLPAGMLVLASLAPPQPSVQDVIRVGLTKGPQSVCSTIANWDADGGPGKYDMVLANYGQLLLALQAGDSKTVIAADARSLDTAVQAALDDPPPGGARSSYMEAATDDLTSAQEFMRGDIQAGKKAADAAWHSYSKYNSVFEECLGFRPPATAGSNAVSVLPASWS